MDAVVIKTSVRRGAGVGIVAQMAVDSGRLGDLVALPATRRFFGRTSTMIAIPRGTLLRNFGSRLMAMLAPQLDWEVLRGRRRAPHQAPEPQIAAFDDRSDLLFSSGDPQEARHAA